MAVDAQGFDSLQVHMKKKIAKLIFVATAIAMASMLFATAPAYGSTTSDYNSKVAAAKAKIAQVQTQLDAAKAQLDALKNSSNAEAQSLAEAQSEVTLAEDALDAAALAYSNASSTYDVAFAEQAIAEDAFNEAVIATNSAIDSLESTYAIYEDAAQASTTAQSEMATAQSNYDNSAITSGSTTATAGLRADIYTGINSQGNPPQRSDSAYTFCKTITVTHIDRNWGNGNIEGCGGDYVMIHYRGFITYPSTTQVFFYAAADDGFFMSIAGQPVINDWSLKGCGGNTAGLFSFTANQSYEIDAWMYEWGGGACNTLYYQPINSGQWSIAPAAFFSQQAKATTTKDLALKVILDQKTEAFVSAVASEELAVENYFAAQELYDSKVSNLESKQSILTTKQSALEAADLAASNAESLWQSNSDTYADKNAILVSRKSRYSAAYAAIETKASEVSTLEASLVAANAELAAIPKPTTPSKTTKKVTSKASVVTKVVARPKFEPIPKR